MTLHRIYWVDIITPQDLMSNVKAQSSNEIQSSNYKIKEEKSFCPEPRWPSGSKEEIHSVKQIV
jgi:hypothetical protein